MSSPSPSVNGEQALHLLRLMAQLAQAAHQGAQPVPGGMPQPGDPQGAPTSAPGLNPGSGPTPSPGSAPMAMAPAMPINGVTAPNYNSVPGVAGVPLPSLPTGVMERTYWLSPETGLLPNRSRNPWTNGPIRSAWSL